MTEAHPPKRPRFRLAGIADLKHMNVRKEGPDDEKILAVDLKLSFEKVDRSICDYFDDALAQFLWRHETNGLIVRNAFMHPVAFAHEISSAEVSIDGRQFFGCEAKKFSVSPRDGGQVDIVCSVSIYPNSGDVAQLAKSVQDGVQVLIEGPPDLFDDDAGAKAAASKLDAMLREDGVTAEITDRAGTTLATFGDGPDPMLDQAIAAVLKHKRASISLVQRELRLGYNRAARLLEAMEARGIVSPMKPNGTRTILTPET